MVSLFALHLSNPITQDEWMMVTKTAEEAEQCGARIVRREAAKGVRLEMILGPIAGPEGPSLPMGQLMKMSGWS